MRLAPASLGLGLLIGLLGAAAACYSDDYLLGALCRRDTDCGDGRCCAGNRCRPNNETDCDAVAGADQPFLAAYMACEDDAACLEHGMPRCVFWQDRSPGFCADYCVGDPADHCSKHPFGAPLTTLPRTCVDVDGQSLCALDCSQGAPCPDTMQCRAGACAPTTPP